MASDYEEKYTEQEWICVLQVRLAAYEDTELTPEEVSALVKDWIRLCMTIRECGGIDRLRELAEADQHYGVVNFKKPFSAAKQLCLSCAASVCKYVENGAKMDGGDSNEAD